MQVCQCPDWTTLWTFDSIELTVRSRDHNFPIVARPTCRPNTSSRRVFGQVISGEVSSIAFLNVKYLTSARRHLFSIPARAASAWSRPFLNDFGPSSIGQHSFAPRQALWCLHPHPSAKEKWRKMCSDVVQIPKQIGVAGGKVAWDIFPWQRVFEN